MYKGISEENLPYFANESILTLNAETRSEIACHEQDGLAEIAKQENAKGKISSYYTE